MTAMARGKLNEAMQGDALGNNMLGRAHQILGRYAIKRGPEFLVDAVIEII